MDKQPIDLLTAAIDALHKSGESFVRAEDAESDYFRQAHCAVSNHWQESARTLALLSLAADMRHIVDVLCAVEQRLAAMHNLQSGMEVNIAGATAWLYQLSNAWTEDAGSDHERIVRSIRTEAMR